MDEITAKLIQSANKYLDEDKPEQARIVLADGLRKNPTSAPLWWALSHAMEKAEQEADCLERVLLYDPGHVEARRRLDELNAPLAPTIAMPAVQKAEPAGELVSSPFDQFPSGTFEEDQAALPATSQPALDETESPDEPAASSQFLTHSEVPVWAEPPVEEPESDVPQNLPAKRRAWVMDLIVIATVLVAILLVVAYFWLKDIGRI